MDDMKILNPDIREVSYGKKSLKKLTLYPLSIGDQFKVTDFVTDIIQKLVRSNAAGDLSDVVFVSAVISALEDNLEKILGLITDLSEIESKEVISDITNTQFVEIVEAIWFVDYEPALKKGRSLYEKVKVIFLSERPSPDSSNSTPSID